MLYGVILAGGKGKRLWPESGRETPKPFLSRSGGISLLDETISRITPLIPRERLIISASREFTAETGRRFSGAIKIIGEPAVRSTAPAIALAALEIESADPNGTMAVFPSDHYIDDAETFRAFIAAASELVEEDPDRLITIGIRPTRPATGYGYIRGSSPLSTPASEKFTFDIHPWEVDSFTEKPNRQTAESYLKSGNFFWNGGIFIWKAKRILDLLAESIPAASSFITELRGTADIHRRTEIIQTDFPRLPSISIDYAVLERAEKIVVLPASFGWNDLGTFEEFTKSGGVPTDEQGNSSLGVELTAVNAAGNIIRFTRQEAASSLYLAGIDNLLIIQKGGKLMIVPKGREDLIQRLADIDEAESGTPSPE